MTKEIPMMKSQLVSPTAHDPAFVTGNSFFIRHSSFVISLFSVFLMASVRLVAQDLEALASGASNDLHAALVDLSAARQQVESERLPLAKRLTELEQKLADRKTEFAKAQRFQENQLVELNALKNEARQRAEEVKYIDSLVSVSLEQRGFEY